LGEKDLYAGERGLADTPKKRSRDVKALREQLKGKENGIKRARRGKVERRKREGKRRALGVIRQQEGRMIVKKN